MTTVYLHCSCALSSYTASTPRGPDPACPVHGLAAAQCASLRAALAVAESSAARLRERIEALEKVVSLAADAMNRMGDVLNDMDCEPEDEAATASAFAAVRFALGKPLEGDAEHLDPALRALSSSAGGDAD